MRITSRGRAPLVGLAAAALLPLCPSPASASPTPTSPAPAATAAAENLRLQALLDELVANGASGALAVVGDGRQIWYQSSGVARQSPPSSLTTAARFRAGGVTKTFIATVTLQLVAEGRLRLTDPVERWLPGLVPGGDAITLRMLLNHTSGLYDYTQDQVLAQWLYTQPTIGVTPRHLVDIATSYPPLFDPGQGWAYSNTDYIVAGMMLEAATGRTVHALVQDRILTPLGLTGTSFPAHTRDIAGYHAHGYLLPATPGGGRPDVTLLAPSLLWAAGALVSTARDLREFYGALLGGRLLPPAQQAELLSSVPVTPVYGYGLGLSVLRGPCGTVWGHDGSVPGYVTLAYTSRDGRRGVVLALPTEPDENLAALLRLTLDTAICQMYDRVPPDAASVPPDAARTRAARAPALGYGWDGGRRPVE
ncbi:MAG: D-alanyl-D-alanine carboxypeptidase [Mycobacteriales bacterium]